MADQSMTASKLRDLKPEIDKVMKSLKKCKDFATEETYVNLERLRQTVWRSNICDRDAVGKYTVDAGYVKLFPKMWKSLSPFLSADAGDSLGFVNLDAMLGTILTLTDKSPEFCSALGKSDCIHLLFEILDNVKIKPDQDYQMKQANYIFGILHNAIHLCRNNRAVYRNCKAIPILEEYLKRDSVSQFNSLLVLAYIVNDKESQLLASSENGVKVLSALLISAVNSIRHKAHISDGLVASAFELLDAINHLAINDDNKRVIEKEGTIPSIIRMLQEDFSQEEQQVAAETLRNLAFIESIRQTEILQGTIPTLERLISQTNNKGLRGACASALWLMRRNNRISTPSAANKPQEPLPPYKYEGTRTDSSFARRKTTQVMVSYQWDSKLLARQIRDRLKKAGYDVWMDETHLRNDILDAMAKAVEESDVILMCMTERYKDSASCRAEAGYAYNKQKKVIPLLLERDYKPDGWLGILLGTKLYYEIYSDEDINTSMVELLKAINDCTSHGKDTADGPNTITEQTVTHAPPPSPDQHVQSPKSRPSKVGDWTIGDVHGWLRENRLSDICSTLHFCKGKHLQKLYSQLQKNEEKFKEEMRADYKMKGPISLQFIVALEELFNEQLEHL